MHECVRVGSRNVKTTAHVDRAITHTPHSAITRRRRTHRNRTIVFKCVLNRRVGGSAMGRARFCVVCVSPKRRDNVSNANKQRRTTSRDTGIHAPRPRRDTATPKIRSLSCDVRLCDIYWNSALVCNVIVNQQQW